MADSEHAILRAPSGLLAKMFIVTVSTRMKVPRNSPQFTSSFHGQSLAAWLVIWCYFSMCKKLKDSTTKVEDVSICAIDVCISFYVYVYVCMCKWNDHYTGSSHAQSPPWPQRDRMFRIQPPRSM